MVRAALQRVFTPQAASGPKHCARQSTWTASLRPRKAKQSEGHTSLRACSSLQIWAGLLQVFLGIAQLGGFCSHPPGARRIVAGVKENGQFLSARTAEYPAPLAAGLADCLAPFCTSLDIREPASPTSPICFLSQSCAAGQPCAMGQVSTAQPRRFSWAYRHLLVRTFLASQARRPAMHQTISTSNWTRAEENPATIAQLLETELEQGWIAKFPGSRADAQQHWPNRTAIGKLNVVFADGKDPRLVLDSAVCNANTLCRIPEQVALPSSLDVHRAFFLRTSAVLGQA